MPTTGDSVAATQPLLVLAMLQTLCANVPTTVGYKKGLLKLKANVAPPSAERKSPKSVATSTTSCGPLVSTFKSRTLPAEVEPSVSRTAGPQVWPTSVLFNTYAPAAALPSNGSPSPR